MISVENAYNMQEREGVEEMRKMEREVEDEECAVEEMEEMRNMELEVAATDAEEMEERRRMAREVAVSEAGRETMRMGVAAR